MGDDVAVIATKEQIVIKKVAKPKFNLAEMVARLPKGYKAKEESFGPPVGKEAW